MTWFFTALDPRARVVGSRDPLGFQQLWTSLGRELVSTLTTVTRSVRGFTTLMMGMELAEELIRDGAFREEDRTKLFLQFEQVAGYARVLTTDQSPLGTQRIKKRLSEGKGVAIGMSPEAKILSDQRTYGLWGLYSASARTAGLLTSDGHRPTDQLSTHVRDLLIPRMTKTTPSTWQQVRRLVERAPATWYPDGRDRPIIDGLGATLDPTLTPAERDFYRRVLVTAESDEREHPAPQEITWSLIRDVNEDGTCDWDQSVGRGELTELRRRADARSETVASSLQAILTLDPLLGLCSRLYAMLLEARSAVPRETLLQSLENQSESSRVVDLAGLESLRPRLTTWSSEGADRLLILANALREGAHDVVLDKLLEQNATVMSARGGSAWAEMRKDRIEVRLRPEALKPPNDIDWESDLFYPYFLPTLKEVGGAVLRGRAT